LRAFFTFPRPVQTAELRHLSAWKTPPGLPCLAAADAPARVFSSEVDPAHVKKV
jgi:hypothetical protein